MKTPAPTRDSTLKLLGDYRVLKIIASLKQGPLRYGGIQRSLPDVNVATLTARLKQLVAGGLLVRTEYNRADVQYALSSLGRKALPIVEAVTRFAAMADIVHAHLAQTQPTNTGTLKQKHDARRRVGYRIY